METTLTIADIQTTGQQHATAAPVRIDPAAYAAVPAGRMFAQQGDLYFRKLLAVPDTAVSVTPFAQLAPGMSLGSRHCLDSLEGVRMYQRVAPGPLEGPIVETSRSVTVTHPEHGHLTFPAGSCWQVTYQRLYADTVRRVED